MSGVGLGNNPGFTGSKDHAGLLALRLVSISIMVALLTMHIRSVRVFRWEQAVSGGLMVTYTVAVVGLALCAGIDECGAKALQLGPRSLYGMRLLAIATVVILMNLHFRSMRRIRPLYQTIPGFLLVVNVAGMISMTICVGVKQCGFYEVKLYLSGVGGILMAVNSATIWRRWRGAGEMTRVVAELLGALGVPLRRQVLIKASLSAAAAVLLLVDLTWILLQSHNNIM